MEALTRESAITHAIAAYPNESCGLVVVVKGKEKYVACKNLATSAKEQFKLDPKDWADAEEMGAITAVVHSHPDASANPSDADRKCCEDSGLPWYIFSIGCEDGEAPHLNSEYAWEPNGWEAPLVGRKFYHGVMDCYTLCRDWYKRERGIDLPDFMRWDNWWNEGANLYMDNIEVAGFEEVSMDPKNFKIGDMVIMQIRGKAPNHAGIYIGDGLILHHLYGRLSSRDVYGGYWKDVTRTVIRYKGTLNEPTENH